MLQNKEKIANQSGIVRFSSIFELKKHDELRCESLINLMGKSYDFYLNEFKSISTIFPLKFLIKKKVRHSLSHLINESTTLHGPLIRTVTHWLNLSQTVGGDCSFEKKYSGLWYVLVIPNNNKPYSMSHYYFHGTQQNKIKRVNKVREYRFNQYKVSCCCFIVVQ